MLNMDYVAQLITQPWMAGIFVSIILLVACRPLYQSIASIKEVNADISEATRVLAELGKNRQEEFYHQFKAVNSQISKIPGLRHTWREFVDSMYFEQTNLPNVPKRVYLSHRPAHYFNRESVLGTRLNLPQFFAYPNYLIGIGLTFTFIGLAAALHVAQAGLASGAGQQALKDLLAVASVKFISSIVGISSSLIISAIQRIRIRGFQERLNAFCDLLEECTKYKSAEKLLHDSVTEQRRFTLLFTDIGNSIGTSISEAFSKQLATGLERALEPLTHDIRHMAERFTQNSEAALKTMTDHFLHELRATSASEMQGLMAGMASLKQSLAELLPQMELAGRNFASSTDTSAAQLAEASHALAGSLAPVELSFSKFGQALQSLETVVEKNAYSANTLNSSAEENKRNLQEFSAIILNVSAAIKQMETLTHTTMDGFKHSAQSVHHTEDGLSHNRELLESLSTNLASMSEMLEQATRQLGKAAHSLDSAAQAHRSAHYFPKLKSRWWKP